MLVLTLLIAWVASVVVRNGLGTCLSYIDNSKGPSLGLFVYTDICNSTDSRQTNWKITNSSTVFGMLTYQFCVNGTKLCMGIQQNLLGIGNKINLKLINDSTLGATTWFALNTKSLPYHLLSGVTGGCAQAYSALQQGGVVNTLSCVVNPIKAQQWNFTSS